MEQNQNLEGLINAALDISTKRAQILTELRLALEHSDNDTALALARKLCGMDSVQ